MHNIEVIDIMRVRCLMCEAKLIKLCSSLLIAQIGFN